MIEINDQGVLITPAGLEDQLGELSVAVRELAHLRIAERALPALIERAVARADAACEALGLDPNSAAVALLSPPALTVWDERDRPPDAGPTTAEEPTPGQASPSVAGEPESDPEGDPPSSGDGDEEEGLRLCESCGADVPDHVPGDSEGVVVCEACEALDASLAGEELPPDPQDPSAVPPAPADAPAEQQAGEPPVPDPVPASSGGRPLGECALAILEVLERAAPAQALASEIAGISGHDVAQVRQTLRRLVESGRVERDDKGHFPLFRLAGAQATIPLTAALMDAAGVESAAA